MSAQLKPHRGILAQAAAVIRRGGKVCLIGWLGGDTQRPPIETTELVTELPREYKGQTLEVETANSRYTVSFMSPDPT